MSEPLALVVSFFWNLEVWKTSFWLSVLFSYELFRHSDIFIRPTYRDEKEMEAERISETIRLSVQVAYNAAKFAEQTASYEAELAVEVATFVVAMEVDPVKGEVTTAFVVAAVVEPG